MRARWPVLVALLALAAAVAGGGCEQVLQWEPPNNGDAGDGGDGGPGADAGDGGDDGGVPNLGDGGTGAWLFSFGPDSQFLRAPADGGMTYPNPLIVRILRGGESGPVQVDFSSADASVAWVPGGAVTVPAGSVTAAVPLNSMAVGSTVLTARFDGGQLQAMVQVLPRIVVSEIAAKTSLDDNDEFVELYNPTPLDFNLSGYTLQYHSTSTTSAYLNICTLGSTKRIAPFSFFLIGINGSTRPEDAHSTWSSGALSATAGTVRLGAPGVSTNFADPLSIDTVAWGSGAVDGEGSPVDIGLINVDLWGSLERKAKSGSTASTMSSGVDQYGGNAYDSNDNSMDFVVHGGGAGAQGPQTSLAPQEFPDGG